MGVSKAIKKLPVWEEISYCVCNGFLPGYWVWSIINRIVRIRCIDSVITNKTGFVNL